MHLSFADAFTIVLQTVAMSLARVLSTGVDIVSCYVLPRYSHFRCFAEEVCVHQVTLLLVSICCANAEGVVRAD